MGKKILYVSDLDFKGSGYQQISIPLCKGLAEMGHDIKIIGLNYSGEEHQFPFSIIPCKTLPMAKAMIHNLNILYAPDVLIVALDLPHHATFIESIKPLGLKYICITPLENPPLTMSWAAPLLSADGVFFISEMGTQAAKDAGIFNAQHLQIGVDSLWVVPEKEDRDRIRQSMELDDKFVILTVADNQERKNLWAAMEMVARVKKGGVNNLKYVMITRESLTYGWRLRDLATELGINGEVSIVERGLSFANLWSYYASADLFLLTSKAEGLGLPVLEAMACGVPVLATHTGALPELLQDGRGYTIQPEYTFRDVWGNAKRDMVNIEQGAEKLKELITTDLRPVTKAAKAYVSGRTWDIAVKQVDKMVKEICDV